MPPGSATRIGIAALAACAALVTLAGCTPIPTQHHSSVRGTQPTVMPTPKRCWSNEPAAIAARLATTPPAPAPTSTPVPGTPFASDPAPDHATGVAELAATEQLAMPEDDFWALIAVLHGSNSDAAYARLTRRLEAEPVQSLVAFDARMTITLWDLDDECRVDWYEQVDPTGLPVLEDDDFLYVRADTVTAGRSTWDTAISTDTLPWGHTNAVDRDGEGLLYVAGDAARAAHGIGGDRWSAMTYDRFPISYESGSNPDGWPPED